MKGKKAGEEERRRRSKSVKNLMGSSQGDERGQGNLPIPT